MNSRRQRKQVRRPGPRPEDGRDPSPAADRPQAPSVLLRPVRESDCRILWQWANDPDLRAMSFNSNPIPWEDHVTWFRSKLASPGCLFYIAELEGGQNIGSVRFDCDGDRATVSVGIDKALRGRGLGTLLVNLASQRVFRDANVAVIQAFIKSQNVASLRAFAKAGYAHAGETEMKGHRAVVMILRKDDVA